MKYTVLAAIVAIFPMTSTAVEQIAGTYSIGIGHRDVAVSLPSKLGRDIDPLLDPSDLSDDSTGLPTAVALTFGANITDKWSLNGEIAQGKGTASSGYEFRIFSSDLGARHIKEDYVSQVDYSYSILTQFRPFGATPFRPYITAGINSLSVSYDYTVTYNRTRLIKEEDTLQSTGLVYGLGFEFFLWRKLDMGFDFIKMTHMKNKADQLSFNLSYSL